MATINGTTAAPSPSKTHTDIVDKTLSDAVQISGHVSFPIGQLTNTGNVAQTVNLEATNAVGCEFVSFDGVLASDVNTSATLPVVVQPGDSYEPSVVVNLPALKVGDPNGTFSLDVTDTWS